MESDTKKAQKERFLERKKANAGKREYVVKTSLPGKIKESSIACELDKWVLQVSKITNKGSLVLNRTLIHCLNNNVQLPDLTDQTFYTQCMTVGINKRKFTKVNKALDDTWNLVFDKSFPSIDRIDGDGQAISYASKTYATNFKNSLIYNFDSRQKTFLRQKIQDLGLEMDSLHPIRCAINGFTCRSEVPVQAKSFVEEQRRFLNPPENGITLTWIGNNMETVVRYYWSILKYLEEYENTKRFNIAPVSRIKRHFVTVDTNILYNLMRNVNLLDKKCKIGDFKVLKDEHFRSIFNFKNLKYEHFSYLIETDGVSICFHFRKIPKEEKQVGNRELKKANRVIGIDPGRTNLIYGVEKLDDGSLKEYKLTRSQYYMDSGMTQANNRTKKWMKKIAEEELIFSDTNTKTTCLEQWDTHLKDYVSVYYALWDEKTKKKWSRSKFRVYRLKRKTLDTFFHVLQVSNSHVVN